MRPACLRRLAPWSLVFGLATLACGCVTDVEDEDSFVDEETIDAEVELVEGGESLAGGDENVDARLDVPNASGGPVEIGLEMEPVPEPWQGKGNEK